VVLGGNLRSSEVEIMVYHLQAGVAEYFLEREDITTIQQVIYSKGVAT